MSWTPFLQVPSAWVRVDLKRAATSFCSEESGAVTVDWVVLTAAVVGLGLASAAVVSAGVGTVSNDTADAISGTPIAMSFARASDLFSSGFSDGANGWLGGTATSLAGFGDVLQLGAGETAELTLAVPAGAQSATLSFDLIAGDDLDAGDTATIMVNGQAVSFYEDDHGNVSVSGNAPAGFTVDVEHQYINDPVGAGSHGHDSVSTYTITVNDPGTSVTLGVHSGTDEPVSSEFYALDNVTVTSN